MYLAIRSPSETIHHLRLGSAMLTMCLPETRSAVQLLAHQRPRFARHSEIIKLESSKR
jgi:hypothetical protein